MCDQIAGLCIFFVLYSFWCFIYIYIPGHIYITILSVSLIHRSIQIVFILFILHGSAAAPVQLPQLSCPSSAAPAQLPQLSCPAQLFQLSCLLKSGLERSPLWFATKSSIYIKSYITNYHVYFEPRFLWNFWLSSGLSWAAVFHTIFLQILGLSLLPKVDFFKQLLEQTYP